MHDTGCSGLVHWDYLRGMGWGGRWEGFQDGEHIYTPSHLSGSPQCTSPEHPVSCIKPGLAICFTYDILHVSMPFSHIILPLPSPTESKRLFYTSVSLLLSRIQGYRYHLSKFHIYALLLLLLLSRFSRVRLCATP